MRRLRQRLGHPALRFLALGGLLYGLVEALGPADPPPQLVVDQAWVDRAVADWRRETGRSPNEAELRASLEARVDEAVLIAQALRLELDRRDPVAREVLLDHWRFLHPEDPCRDATCLRRIRALGMNATDPVVRRRLIQLMRERLVPEPRISPDELAAYVHAHPERYGGVLRYTVEQVYFGDHERARDLAMRGYDGLRAGLPPEEMGLPFVLGHRWPALSEAELARRYGEPLAEQVRRATSGAWLPPVASPFGWHVLRVVEQHPERQTADHEALRRAAYRLAEQKREAGWREAVARLREGWIVVWPQDEGAS